MADKATRIRWTDEEVYKLVRRNPKIAIEQQGNPERADHIMAALRGNALPKDRQRSRKLVLFSLNSSGNGQGWLRGQIERAAAKLQAERSTSVQEEQVAPLDIVHTPHKTRAGAIQWRKQEWTRMAHDEEVKAILGTMHEMKRADAVAVIVRAQQRQLPEHRWRPEEKIHINLKAKGTGKNYSRGAIELLREGIKYQPKEPIVSIHAPLPVRTVQVEPVIEEKHEDVVQEVAQIVQEREAQVAAAAPTEQPRASLGSALAGLIETAIGKLRTGIMESVNEGIDRAMTQALQDATQQLRASNVSSIAELLGGSPAPVPDTPASVVQKAQEAREVMGALQESASPKARGPRVDVVGLQVGQVEAVKQAMGSKFDLRFLTPEELDRRPLTAPTTIMLTNAVPHRSRLKIEAHGSRLIHANGAISSVIKELQALHH